MAALCALLRLLSERPVRRYGALDSLNAILGACQSLLERQGGSLLYSPVARLAWCAWLPLSQERGTILAL
ncbi:hypothetical protein NDU88_008468 [Pleurodeles waltl]|uniref:Uncharacterized protein n=1 Tax=Pleurodeles waltl TaxID=8319 RepID=A0AAV7PS79_PLEWA|nr:hypothetical protein NDU88_008468 [Pleurodeles waltl]